MIRTHPLVSSVDLFMIFVSRLKIMQVTILCDHWGAVATVLKLDTCIRQQCSFLLFSVNYNSKISIFLPIALVLCLVNNIIAESFDVFLIESFLLFKCPKQDNARHRCIWTEMITSKHTNVCYYLKCIAFLWKTKKGLENGFLVKSRHESDPDHIRTLHWLP